MPIDFPNSPSVDDQFTSGTTTWRWDGSVWKVIRDFAPTGATGPTGPTGSVGNTGATGLTGINWRAAFDFVAYSVGDVVQYSGNAYFCNTAISAEDSTSHIPGSSARWDLLSAKGNTGAQGGTGETGPTGDDGQFSVAATTPPAAPETGDAWYDSASGNLYVYYDGYWVEAASANDGPTGNTGATGAAGQTGATGPTGDDGQFSIADTTPPAAPETGDAWYDSASGNLYVYYDGYWVEAASANDGPTGNTGATGAAGATGSTGPTGMAFAQPSEPADPQDGQIWLDTDGSVAGQQVVRWSKAPTGGTTSLSGLDDSSVTLSYTTGYEQVFRNGVLLSRGNDYTATSGNSITLIDATITGDIIEVIGSSVLAIADVYTQAQADANYVGKALVDAKGDIVTASADNTPARLAVGNDGETLVADSSTATGLAYTPTFFAGKNKIINGDFRINQRGFTTISASGAYGFDRWQLGLSGATGTMTAETFTPGAAPVAGYEGINFARVTITTGNDFARINQSIEDVRTFAGQTATISFWAKGTNPTTAGNLKVDLEQNFGSGGSPSATVVVTEQTFVLTANWTRYSLTFNVPSISGKTIGTNANSSYLGIRIGQGSSISTDAWTLDIWGVQAEAGSVATAFQTATGTIQGELAACQRYYYQLGYLDIPAAYAGSTTSTTCIVRFPVQMRTAPTGITVSSTGDWRVYNQAGSFGTSTAITFNNAFTTGTLITVTTGAGSPTLTAGFGGFLYGVNPTAVIGFTGAEL